MFSWFESDSDPEVLATSSIGSPIGVTQSAYAGAFDLMSTLIYPRPCYAASVLIPLDPYFNGAEALVYELDSDIVEALTSYA